MGLYWNMDKRSPELWKKRYTFDNVHRIGKDISFKQRANSFAMIADNSELILLKKDDWDYIWPGRLLKVQTFDMNLTEL